MTTRELAPSQVKPSLLGSQLRLSQIQDALSTQPIVPQSRLVASQTRLSQGTGSQRGHERRLKEIQDALTRNNLVLSETQTTGLTNQPSTLKRSRCSSSSSSPTAKRHQLSRKATSPPPSPVSTSSAYDSSPEPELASQTGREASPAARPRRIDISVEIEVCNCQSSFSNANVTDLWKSKESSITGPGPRGKNHMADFFRQYPAFSYNPSSSCTDEYDRLQRFFGWIKGTDRAARGEFENAMSQTFNSSYGTDIDDLSCWRKLCSVLGITDVPITLEACRDVCASCHHV